MLQLPQSTSSAFWLPPEHGESKEEDEERKVRWVKGWCALDEPGWGTMHRGSGCEWHENVGNVKLWKLGNVN